MSHAVCRASGPVTFPGTVTQMASSDARRLDTFTGTVTTMIAESVHIPEVPERTVTPLALSDARQLEVFTGDRLASARWFGIRLPVTFPGTVMRQEAECEHTGKCSGRVPGNGHREAGDAAARQLLGMSPETRSSRRTARDRCMSAHDTLWIVCDRLCCVSQQTGSSQRAARDRCVSSVRRPNTRCRQTETLLSPARRRDRAKIITSQALANEGIPATQAGRR